MLYSVSKSSSIFAVAAFAVGSVDGLKIASPDNSTKLGDDGRRLFASFGSVEAGHVDSDMSSDGESGDNLEGNSDLRDGAGDTSFIHVRNDNVEEKCPQENFWVLREMRIFGKGFSEPDFKFWGRVLEVDFQNMLPKPLQSDRNS